MATTFTVFTMVGHTNGHFGENYKVHMEKFSQKVQEWNTKNVPPNLSTVIHCLVESVHEFFENPNHENVGVFWEQCEEKPVVNLEASEGYSCMVRLLLDHFVFEVLSITGNKWPQLFTSS
jgi:hypothetical protein